MEEVDLILREPPITGRMNYLIGNVLINRDDYWNMTDGERQAFHNRHKPGSKAMIFDMRFAEKHGRKL